MKTALFSRGAKARTNPGAVGREDNICDVVIVGGGNVPMARATRAYLAKELDY